MSAAETNQPSEQVGLLKAEAGLHVDGYPNAKRVVKWDSKKTERLAVLRVHESSLRFCQAAMQEFLKISPELPIASYAALIGIVAKYFSCFGKNLANGPLSPDKVFKGMPEAKECFVYWKKIRDSHFINEEGVLNERVTGIVLGENEEAVDVVNLSVTASVSDFEHQQLLYNLISHTLAHVIDDSEALRQSILEDAGKLSAEDRKNLADLRIDIPSRERLP